jgi:hypothetical protein
LDEQRPIKDSPAVDADHSHTASTQEVKSGVTLPVKVSELRRKLGEKAKQQPKFRFYTLYDRVYRLDVLTAAWWLVLKNDGAPGVDGLSCRDIMDGPGAARFLQELHEELRTNAIGRNRSGVSTSPSRTAGPDRWEYPRFGIGSYRWRWS